MQFEKHDTLAKKIAISSTEALNKQINIELNNNLSDSKISLYFKAKNLINKIETEIGEFTTLELKDEVGKVIISTSNKHDKDRIESNSPDKINEINNTWKSVKNENEIVFGGAIKDRSLNTIGSHELTINISKVHDKNKEIKWTFLAWLTMCKLIATIVLIIGIYTVTKLITGSISIHRGMISLAMFVMLSAGIAISSISTDMIYENLRPNLQRTINSISAITASDFEYNLKNTKNLKEALFKSDYLQGIPAADGFDYVLRVSESNNLIYQSSDEKTSSISSKSEIKFTENNVKKIAAVEVFLSEKQYRRIFISALEDIVIILLVGTIFFNEIIGWFYNSSSIDNNKSTDNSILSLLRLPLFLFVLTEELTKSFLPLRIKQLALNFPTYSDGLIGLPITLYMLTFAISTPFGGRLSDKHGSKNMIAFGAFLSSLGFLWGALTNSFVDFTLARCCNAAGYAFVTMAVQRVIMSETDSKVRTQGLAMFIGAVGIAAICGSSLGGVIAQHLGFDSVFLLSMIICIISILFFICVPKLDSYDTTPEAPSRISDIYVLLKNSRFMTYMICGSIPNKIALAGLLYYVTPLALTAKGFDSAEIGRFIMLYYICLIFTTPLTSKLSIKYSLRNSLIGIGGLTIGIGSLASYFLLDYGTFIFVCGLGIGTGMSAASLQSISTESGIENVAIGRTSAMSAYRTIERIGSAFGPILAGLLVVIHGYDLAMIGVGILVIVCTVILCALLFINNRQKDCTRSF